MTRVRRPESSALAAPSRPGPDTVALCILVVAAPQLFGGAFPWAVAVIAGLSLGAFGLALWVHRKSPPPLFDGVLLVMGLAWAWTCIQALPLPLGLAQALRLSSVQSAQRLQGLEWAGTIPLTISGDPGSTLLEILVGVAIVCAFAAARLGGPSGLKPIAGAIVVSALLLGLEGLAHRLAGTDAVFGLYVPRFAQPHLLTPLMNGNHLGGFALMGSVLGAGLAAQRCPPSKRFWALASATSALVVAGTLSRGAIGSLLFAFVLLAAWLLGRGHERRTSAVPLAVSIAAIVGASAFFGLEPILRRFETQGFDKLAVAARGFRLLQGPAWWLGIGRGAFSSVFVAEEGSAARYTHPENLVVQWLAEWGVPLGLALLTVLLVSLWRRFRAADQPIGAAACIAIFALSLQNLVDFSLEMAGVVVVVACLFGALLPAAPERGARASIRLSLVGLASMAVALAVVTPRALASDVQSLVDRLAGTMRANREDDFRQALRRGLALHPNEPAFALLAGTYAGALGHADAPRWISVVMQEAPGWASPHALAAQWLFERGHLDQALLEIRQAEQRQPGSAQRVLCELIARFPSMAHLERAAPDEALRPAYLDRSSACPALPPELRAEIDEAILRSEPTRLNAVLRQARRLLSQKQQSEAISLLEHALVAHGNEVTLWNAIIRAHLDAGEVEAASHALGDARAKNLESRSLYEAQARIEAALDEPEAMRTTLTRLRGQAEGDSGKVAASFLLQGELEAAMGNVEEALSAYISADAASPETPALQRAAALALRSGRLSRARRLYQTLCYRDHKSPACAQEARLTEEMRQAPVRRPIP